MQYSFCLWSALYLGIWAEVVCVLRCSLVSDTFATPWTVAHQAPPSMGFPRQEYWSGLPFPSPGDLPNTGIEHLSPALAGGSLPLSHQGNLSWGFEVVDKKKEFELSVMSRWMGQLSAPELMRQGGRTLACNNTGILDVVRHSVEQHDLENGKSQGRLAYK